MAVLLDDVVFKLQLRRVHHKLISDDDRRADASQLDRLIETLADTCRESAFESDFFQ
jgi:hypothetical protein